MRCVAGERHSVGARLVADFFQVSGWSLCYLGADVPTKDLLGFVRAQRPDIVALSVTVDDSEDALRQAINLLDLPELTPIKIEDAGAQP